MIVKLKISTLASPSLSIKDGPPIDSMISSKNTSKDQSLIHGRSDDATMSKVTGDLGSCSNLNVVPPSHDNTISPPICVLNELDDDCFIEFILANKGPSNTKSLNQVGAKFNGNLGHSDCMMT